MSHPLPPVGVVLGSAQAPEDIPGAAKLAEDLGFTAVWLSEDYFFTGAISSATASLAATQHVDVGLGIVSALTRHPALLAMEVASLARMHPGRLRVAVGLGMPSWMQQMGLTPPSSLAAVRSCVSALRALLAGEEVTADEGPYSFDRIRLTHPVLDDPPPIWMGVSGPAMLRLAGEVADGVLVSVKAGVDYVRWARQRIAEGAVQAGREDARVDMTVLSFIAVDEDGDRARALMRHRLAYYLAARPDSPVTRPYGITETLQELAAHGAAHVEAEMPNEWVEDLAIAGTPAECAARVRRLIDAGADQVGLVPVPAEDSHRILHLVSQEMLPQLRS